MLIAGHRRLLPAHPVRPRTESGTHPALSSPASVRMKTLPHEPSRSAWSTDDRVRGPWPVAPLMTPIARPATDAFTLHLRFATCVRCPVSLPRRPGLVKGRGPADAPSHPPSSLRSGGDRANSDLDVSFRPAGRDLPATVQSPCGPSVDRADRDRRRGGRLGRPVRLGPHPLPPARTGGRRSLDLPRRSRHGDATPEARSPGDAARPPSSADRGASGRDA